MYFLRLNRSLSSSTLPSSTTSTWSTAKALHAKIKTLVDSQQHRQALQLFHQQNHISIDGTITLALKAAAAIRDHASGIRIHRQLSKQSLNNPWIQSSLVYFYMRCDDIENAEKMFSSIKNKTVFVYGSMFKGYISHGKPEKVIEEFNHLSIEPDEVLLNLLSDACAECKNDDSIRVGKDVMKTLPLKYLKDEKVINSAISMLMNWGEVKKAEDLFESMTTKDIVAYGDMIKGYHENRMPRKVLDLFEKIRDKSDDLTQIIAFRACTILGDEKAIRLGNDMVRQLPSVYKKDSNYVGSILDMLMKFGQTEDAEHIFTNMKGHNVDTFSIMMQGYCLNGTPMKSLSMFKKFKETKRRMNEKILLVLISTGAEIASLETCQSIIEEIPVRMLENNTVLNNALIQMWGKSKAVDKAKELFDSLAQPGTDTFNAMIDAYANNDLNMELIDFYCKMPVKMRDIVSHIRALNSCSKSGLTDGIHQIYNEIESKTEEIVATMIDCLIRLSKRDEAQNLINEYQREHPSSCLIQMTLAKANDKNGTTIQCNDMPTPTNNPSDKSERVEDCSLEKNREEQEPTMKSKTLEKKLETIQIDSQVNPQLPEIYAMLDGMSNNMKKQGYQPETSCISRPIGSDETSESVLMGHSEKLAVAFNLIQNPPPSTIYLTINLRMCLDCHNWMKLVAKVYNCEIIARDANRGHHFTPNGQCSCLDFF